MAEAERLHRSGTYRVCSTAGESYKAFIPHPLPPDPPLQLSGEDADLIERANRALGRLDGVTTMLPDTNLFIYLYVRKEALLSSQIEGTQSSFTDLLLYENEEAPGVPIDDVQEVSHYVRAINHGLDRLRGGFPLSLRLLREIHGILLAGTRGSRKAPGEFRRSQNWIGGSRPGNARFVPPPPDEVMPTMGALEKFLHDDPVRTPVLQKAALAHVQFETIHPFLDGNGRLGRLLITLLLCAEDVLAEPVLYLSLYFKTHRDEYYERLQRVRKDGDWEGWVRFFMEGVWQTANQAVDAAREILRLFDEDRRRIGTIGRAAGSALRIHEWLQKQPLTSVPKAAEAPGLSFNTATSALQNLEQLGIVREITGKPRNRLYLYDRYLAILDEGAEPLPR